VAVAASMLTAINDILRDRVPYRDLGPAHFDTLHKARAITGQDRTPADYGGPGDREDHASPRPAPPPCRVLEQKLQNVLTESTAGQRKSAPAVCPANFTRPPVPPPRAPS
jgi:hypothetical protein